MRYPVTFKRILGLILVLAGAAMLLFSQYIKKEVLQGKEKITSAQKKVDTAHSLFSASPYTKEIGSAATGAAQGKIDAGKGEVQKYETIAYWLQIGGIVVIVVGVGAICVGRKKKSKR